MGKASFRSATRQEGTCKQPQFVHWDESKRPTCEHNHERTRQKQNQRSQVVDLLLGMVPHLHVPVHGTKKVQYPLEDKEQAQREVTVAASGVHAECQDERINDSGHVHRTHAGEGLKSISDPCELDLRIVAADVHLGESRVHVTQNACVMESTGNTLDYCFCPPLINHVHDIWSHE